MAVVLVDTGMFGLAARDALHQSDDDVFFETSAVLITFVALGGWLQSYSKSKTGSAVSGFLPVLHMELRRARPFLFVARFLIFSSFFLSFSSFFLLGFTLGTHVRACAYTWEKKCYNPPPSPQVRTLLQLEASEATLLMPAGAGGGVEGAGNSGQYEEKVVPIAMLQRGDLVLVLGGERLPCDGTLAKSLSHGG